MINLGKPYKDFENLNQRSNGMQTLEQKRLKILGG